MTDPNKDLVLDANGIPILTDLVRENATPGSTKQPQENDVSVDDLAGLLLNSDTFRQQLDEIATELTRTVRQQVELTLRSTLEEAISQAFNGSSTSSYEAVREQLETALPDLLAHTRQN